MYSEFIKVESLYEIDGIVQYLWEDKPPTMVIGLDWLGLVPRFLLKG